jgi:hypothetical protein
MSSRMTGPAPDTSVKSIMPNGIILKSTSPEEAKTHDAVAHDHDGSEDRIAGKTGVFRWSLRHDGDDKRSLDHGHRQGEDKGERLARAMTTSAW